MPISFVHQVGWLNPTCFGSTESSYGHNDGRRKRRAGLVLKNVEKDFEHMANSLRERFSGLMHRLLSIANNALRIN